MNTELASKMIALADAHELPSGHEMRVRALEFEEAAKGFTSQPQTRDARAVVGSWARAKKAWCNYTGEPLI